MSSNSRLCGTFNKGGKYMMNVLAISEGESQLLKVKRKTHCRRRFTDVGVNHAHKKQQKRIKSFQNLQFFIQNIIAIQFKNDN
jgi:hypothetical protein